MTLSTRPIGAHHLAFYRGWLQGIELKVLADRYLETGLDLRLAKSTLIWLRDTLSQAALRHGHRRDARLLKLRLLSQPDEALLRIPSLEAFRDEYDPDEFFREEELIRHYIAHFPQAADKRARQRQRMILRQLEALRWIEPLLTTQPVPADSVLAWFDTSIAERLLSAGIPTLEALLERLQERGYRWWVTVPRLGEKGAARILTWLSTYESTLGALPRHALTPVRRQLPTSGTQARHRETAIVPIEALVLPEGLRGETGSNRYRGTPRIEADDDYAAIHCWLATKAGSTHTERAYRKEAERLLLWASIERQKALSDLSVEDCTAYRNWLSMLGRTPDSSWSFQVPQAQWIGKRNTPRFSTGWRPFDAALSASSVRQALTIVSSLMEWLVSVQYCAFNPWSAVSKKAVISDDMPVDVELTRAFSEGQWRYLNDYLGKLPGDPQTQRLKFILPFAYTTGLRLSELVDAKTGRLYAMPCRETLGLRWMLKVHGKGNKWRAVPFPESLLHTLGEALVQRGLHADPLSNPPETPLISRVDSNHAISTSSLYKLLKTLFQEVANGLQQEGRIQEAKAFAQASVHWLRHTRGSHLGNAGVPPNLIQKLLGHASLATTSIYMESDEERLWQELVVQEASHAD